MIAPKRSVLVNPRDAQNAHKALQRADQKAATPTAAAQKAAALNRAQQPAGAVITAITERQKRGNPHETEEDEEQEKGPELLDT